MGRCFITSTNLAFIFSNWVGQNWIWFIVRSGETGLGRWLQVVAVISVHAYPFWVFSDLTYHLKDTEIGVFLVALCCLISRDTEIGSNNQDTPPSAGKNNEAVLGSCAYSYFWCFRYFRGPWVSFVMIDVFLMRVTKLLQGLVPH